MTGKKITTLVLAAVVSTGALGTVYAQTSDAGADPASSGPIAPIDPSTIDPAADPDLALGLISAAYETGGWVAVAAVVIMLLVGFLRRRLPKWWPWFSSKLGAVVLYFGVGVVVGMAQSAYDQELKWETVLGTLGAVVLAALVDAVRRSKNTPR